MTRLSDDECEALRGGLKSLLGDFSVEDVLSRKPYARIIGEGPGRAAWASPLAWKDSPLFPYPKLSSGYRLAVMSELSPFDYLSLYERHNLLDHPNWDIHEAQARTWKLCDGTPLVLLGSKVAAAFEYGARPFEWCILADQLTWAVMIPHPSGRNPQLNDPATRARVRTTLWTAIRRGYGTRDAYEPIRVHSCDVCGLRPECHRPHPTAPNTWVTCPGSRMPRVLPSCGLTSAW